MPRKYNMNPARKAAYQKAWNKRLKEWMAAGLGKDIDQIVGDRMGVSRERVRQIRKRAGLPAPSLQIWQDKREQKEEKRLDRKWANLANRRKFIMAGMGQVQDKVVADKLNTHTSTVCQMRNRMNIKPALHRTGRPVEFSIEDALDVGYGTLPVKQVAAILGCSVSTVYKWQYKLDAVSKTRK